MITYSDETTDKTATVNALVENNTETLETSFDQIALSSRKIIITAGNGVRVCKVKAYVDDMTNLSSFIRTNHMINATFSVNLMRLSCFRLRLLKIHATLFDFFEE